MAEEKSPQEEYRHPGRQYYLFRFAQGFFYAVVGAALFLAAFVQASSGMFFLATLSTLLIGSVLVGAWFVWQERNERKRFSQAWQEIQQKNKNYQTEINQILNNSALPDEVRNRLQNLYDNQQYYGDGKHAPSIDNSPNGLDVLVVAAEQGWSAILRTREGLLTVRYLSMGLLTITGFGSIASSAGSIQWGLVALGVVPVLMVCWVLGMMVDSLEDKLSGQRRQDYRNIVANCQKTYQKLSLLKHWQAVYAAKPSVAARAVEGKSVPVEYAAKDVHPQTSVDRMAELLSIVNSDYQLDVVMPLNPGQLRLSPAEHGRHWTLTYIDNAGKIVSQPLWKSLDQSIADCNKALCNAWFRKQDWQNIEWAESIALKIKGALGLPNDQAYQLDMQPALRSNQLRLVKTPDRHHWHLSYLQSSFFALQPREISVELDTVDHPALRKIYYGSIKTSAIENWRSPAWRSERALEFARALELQGSKAQRSEAFLGKEGNSAVNYPQIKGLMAKEEDAPLSDVVKWKRRGYVFFWFLKGVCYSSIFMLLVLQHLPAGFLLPVALPVSLLVGGVLAIIQYKIYNDKLVHERAWVHGVEEERKAWKLSKKNHTQLPADAEKAAPPVRGTGLLSVFVTPFRKLFTWFKKLRVWFRHLQANQIPGFRPERGDARILGMDFDCKYRRLGINYCLREIAELDNKIQVCRTQLPASLAQSVGVDWASVLAEFNCEHRNMHTESPHLVANWANKLYEAWIVKASMLALAFFWHGTILAGVFMSLSGVMENFFQIATTPTGIGLLLFVVAVLIAMGEGIKKLDYWLVGHLDERKARLMRDHQLVYNLYLTLQNELQTVEAYKKIVNDGSDGAGQLCQQPSSKPNLAPQDQHDSALDYGDEHGNGEANFSSPIHTPRSSVNQPAEAHQGKTMVSDNGVKS